MTDTPPSAPRHPARLLALRAIMDGREVEAVVLRDPACVAHYAGRDEVADAVLVVTAGDAVLIAAVDADAGGAPVHGLRVMTADSDAAVWDRVIAAVGRARRVGYDLFPVAPLGQVPMLPLGPLMSRQIADHAARPQGAM